MTHYRVRASKYVFGVCVLGGGVHSAIANAKILTYIKQKSKLTPIFDSVIAWI